MAKAVNIQGISDIYLLFFANKLKTLPAGFFFQALNFQLFALENIEKLLVRGL